jgi:hypothetical protein
MKDFSQIVKRFYFWIRSYSLDSFPGEALKRFFSFPQFFQFCPIRHRIHRLRPHTLHHAIRQTILQRDTEHHSLN